MLGGGAVEAQRPELSAVPAGRGRAGSLPLPGSGEGRPPGGAGDLNLPQGEEKPRCGFEAVSCRASVNSAGIINQVSEMSLNPFSRITVVATRHFLPLPSLFPTPNTSFLFRFFARFISLTECNIHSCTLETTPGLAGGELSASSLKSAFESPPTVGSESLLKRIKENSFRVLSRN